MAAKVEFEIDDAKSVVENHEAFKKKLKELDPLLGPILASFLPELTKEPTGEKAAMLAALRAELAKPPVAEAQQ